MNFTGITYKDSPFYLETNRLMMRRFKASDAEGFYEMNRDPLVMQFTGDLPFNSLEEANYFIQSYTQYRENGFGRWALLIKRSEEFIGFCGFKLNEEGLIDLGFRLKRQFWGQGLATEAAIACLYYGFSVLDFEQVIGRVARGNKASIRVLHKIGMEYWKDGTCGPLADSLYFRITKDQFALDTNLT